MKSDQAAAGLTRRGFMPLAGIAAAVVGLSATVVRAEGQIGSYAMDLPDDRLTGMLRTILRVRWHGRTVADKMLSDPAYRAFNHFYAGQEAVVTGVCAPLRNEGPFDQPDLVSSTHRPSGHALAKGVDMALMQAEMDFPATGLNGGHAAKRHTADPSFGFVGADGMIGPGHVIATGSAFAVRGRRSDQVAVVFQVCSAAKEAVDRARAGGGPSFIETKTYRSYNHWGAPGVEVGKLGAFGYAPPAIPSFRPQREVRAWMQRDPVDIARKTLIDWGVLVAAAADALEAEVKAEVEAAFKWAAEQPLCKPEDGLKHVFAEGEVLPRQIA